MVAPSPSNNAFTPDDRPRVTVAADGSLAAIQEPTKITIAELPSCVGFAELGTDTAAQVCEVAWVGTPPRLLVLSKFESHSVVHLVDPFGPRTIAEIRLQTPMRLSSSVGNHALAIGPHGAAILAASDKALTPYQFPARTIPLTAGAAGTQFVVALPNSIEEWDPQNRMPKRRLKLPRPVTITAVGGSERVVWMTTQQEPSRIDVIPFVNRGQPKAHDLPEPIASVASHPRSDVIACIGAQSGRLWVVDLDGRNGLRMVGPEGIDRAEAVSIVLGRTSGVLAAQAKHRVTVVALDRIEPPVEGERVKPVSAPPPMARELLYGADDGEQPGDVPTSVTLASPALATADTVPPPAAPKPVEPTQPETPFSASASPLTSPFAAGHATGMSPFASSKATTVGVPIPAAAPRPKSESTMEMLEVQKTAPIQQIREPAASPPPRASTADGIGTAPRRPSGQILAVDPLLVGRDTRRGTAETIQAVQIDERRDYFKAFRERIEHPRARTAEPVAAVWSQASATWRNELCAWGTTIGISAEVVEPAPSSPIDQLAQRFDLTPPLDQVVALLYAHHLMGHDGAAPLEIARALGGRWDEALGRGELAQRGICVFRDSRVRLTELVYRALDEMPPRCGTLFGAPGVVSLLGPCVIVAGGPLAIIAEACIPSIGGAILAANSECDPQDLANEARAYGAAPLWRVRAELLSKVPTEQPFILVADDDTTADLLGVPRLT